MEKNKGYVYIYKQDILDVRDIYKVGRASCIIKRENDYKTLSPYGRMLFAIKTDNVVEVETKVLSTLQEKYEVHGEV